MGSEPRGGSVLFVARVPKTVGFDEDFVDGVGAGVDDLLGESEERVENESEPRLKGGTKSKDSRLTRQ